MNTESVQCLLRLHNVNLDVKSGCMTASLVSVSNSVQIYAKMADLWPKVIFNMAAAPSWILKNSNFTCKISYRTPFSVSMWNFGQIGWKKAELWPFNGFQDGRRRHLGFLIYVNFDGKSGCRTPLSVYVSNLVQIYAKLADLWPKMWFSIWRPPPSWS